MYSPFSDEKASGEAAHAPVSPNQAPQLRRTMSFADGVGIVVGIMIGSGIFASSGNVVADAGSPGLALLVWVVSALLVCLSLLSYAELGTCLPSAGGESLYFLRAFGPVVSFCYVVTQYFVLNTGSQAIICMVFSRYFGSVIFGGASIDEDIDSQLRYKLLAGAALVVLNAMNLLGSRVGNSMQNVLTVTKVLLAVVCSLVGVIHMFTDSDIVKGNLGSTAFEGSSMTGFAKALVGALWAFDGFSYAIYFAEDLRRPRQLPLILLTGILVVLVLYIIMNVGYMAVLPQDIITKTDTIGIDFAEAGVAKWAGTAIALGIALSSFGSANGSIMSGARIYWSAARGGQFPKALTKVNRNNVPYNAHAAQLAWSCIVLTFPFSFSGLLSYFGFAAWLFYGLSSVAVIRLRYTEPDLPRPFRTPGYPYVPIAAAGLSLVLCVALISEDPVPSLGALVFVLLGWPTYVIGKRYGCIRAPEPVVGEATHIVEGDGLLSQGSTPQGSPDAVLVSDVELSSRRSE